MSSYSGVQVFILPTRHGVAEAERDRVLKECAREGDLLLHEEGETLPKLEGVVARSWYNPAVTAVMREACSLVDRLKACSEDQLVGLFKDKLPPKFEGDIRALLGRAVQMRLYQVCKETFASNQTHLLETLRCMLPDEGKGRLFVSMGKNHAKDPELTRLLEDSNLKYAIFYP
jgi:hypothetical protein